MIQNSLRVAKVVRAHPGGHAVDLVFLDDGSRVPAVQVLSTAASTNTGLNDLPQPTMSSEEYDARETGDRDIYAMVAFMRDMPIVLGFLFPQICQMLFADQNRRIMRHASDVYTTIDGEGNTELYHPSGTYLRISTDGAHEDLTGRDYDGKWAIAKNTDKAVHVRLVVANAGVQKASIDIDPAGNITESNVGNLSASVGGAVAVTAGGNINATSGAQITLAAADKIRMTAPQIEIHGDESVRWDVDGYGRRVRSEGGGTYTDTTWTLTSTVIPDPQAIAPPEVP